MLEGSSTSSIFSSFTASGCRPPMYLVTTADNRTVDVSWESLSPCAEPPQEILDGRHLSASSSGPLLPPQAPAGPGPTSSSPQLPPRPPAPSASSAAPPVPPPMVPAPASSSGTQVEPSSRQLCTHNACQLWYLLP